MSRKLKDGFSTSVGRLSFFIKSLVNFFSLCYDNKIRKDEHGVCGYGILCVHREGEQ